MGPVKSLENFVVERVLGEDARAKFMHVLGRFAGKDGKAVITLAQRHFDESTLQDLLSPSMHLDLQFQNDVYSKYTARVKDKHLLLNVDIVYPATDKHINKYATQKLHMVRETPQIYRNVTLPVILSAATSLQWVRNILDKTAEADRLIFEDPDPDTGFMLHPDMKWDQKLITSMYCIALCKRTDIQSVRDLRREHLPLLQNIRAKGHQAVLNKYGVQPDEVRMFLHYQPSYYHLHVHFTHVLFDGGPGMAAGKAILLDDIIENIAYVASDYYAQRTLTYCLREEDELFQALKSHRCPPAFNSTGRS